MGASILMIFPGGGHLWLGRDASVADEVQRGVAGTRTGRVSGPPSLAVG